MKGFRNGEVHSKGFRDTRFWMKPTQHSNLDFINQPIDQNWKKDSGLRKCHKSKIANS